MECSVVPGPIGRTMSLILIYMSVFFFYISLFLCIHNNEYICIFSEIKWNLLKHNREHSHIVMRNIFKNNRIHKVSLNKYIYLFWECRQSCLPENSSILDNVSMKFNNFSNIIHDTWIYGEDIHCTTLNDLALTISTCRNESIGNHSLAIVTYIRKLSS